MLVLMEIKVIMRIVLESVMCLPTQRIEKAQLVKTSPSLQAQSFMTGVVRIGLFYTRSDLWGSQLGSCAVEVLLPSLVGSLICPSPVVKVLSIGKLQDTHECVSNRFKGSIFFGYLASVPGCCPISLVFEGLVIQEKSLCSAMWGCAFGNVKPTKLMCFKPCKGGSILRVDLASCAYLRLLLICSISSFEGSLKLNAIWIAVFGTFKVSCGLLLVRC